MMLRIFRKTTVNRQQSTDNSQQTLELNRIFILGSNSCRLGEMALRNYESEALRTKSCLSAASSFCLAKES